MCKTPISYAVEYISTRYPYCNIAMVGEMRDLSYALEKGGNRVVEFSSTNAETARFCVAIGGEEEAKIAKSSGLPYLVISQHVPLSIFNKFAIYDFQKVEYGYPNLVILDNSRNEYLFQAEVRTLLLALYLECLDTLGSGLKGEKQKRAKQLLLDLRKALNDFRTVEELLTLCKNGIEIIEGLEYVSYLYEVLKLFHPENDLHARFYAVFSLLYLERRFTNIDFWVILPYMDEVRLRTFAESHGIKPPPSKRRNVDVAFLLNMVEMHIPTERELTDSLNGFRLEAGECKVDFHALLLAIMLSAELCPKKEMVRDIVESGYVDALIS